MVGGDGITHHPFTWIKMFSVTSKWPLGLFSEEGAMWGYFTKGLGGKPDLNDKNQCGLRRGAGAHVKHTEVLGLVHSVSSLLCFTLAFLTKWATSVCKQLRAVEAAAAAVGQNGTECNTHSHKAC